METAEISTLNNRPDWLSMQYDSFCRFFSRKTSVDGFSLQHILGRHGVIQLEGDHTLSIKEWSLDEPNRGPEECIFSNCNYSRDLWFTFSVTGPRIGGREFQFSRCMVRLPVPTHDSEFILSSEQDKKANRYAMVMQLAPSPGLYYRERDSGASRSCTIIPAIGKRVVFRARKAKTGEKLSFLMGGFKLSLEDFRKVLDTDGPDDDDLTTLRSLYRYLFNRNLLPTDKQILYISEADIDGLAFVRQIFKKYLASFDMSCLGKKQMTSLLRDKTDGGTTLLGLEELEKIIDHFINRKLPQTDDRSLKYRKVKLIGDFLFELLEQSMVWLMNHVRNRWEFWGATESSRERGGSASSLRKEGLRSLIPYRPFQQLVDNFFRENSLIQLLDDTNPLSEISQKRRISFRGPGGIPERVLFLEKRDVHFTDFGRVCPVETPQGEDLGFNLYLAQNARINSLGLIEAPYVDLNSNEELFLDPYEEEEKVKAARVNPQTSKDGIAYVRTPTEEMAIMDESKITHALYGPCSFMGYAASLIPFIQHNDANRALMGANMMKQALPLLKPEPPMIRTGFESKIGEQCCRCSPFINNGHLCLGKNLLVGYMPWDLLNYEDGIVISDRLVQKDILTHVETGEFIVDEESYKGEGQFEEITADNPHLSESDRQKLDGMGVIREKESIGPGTLLVSKLRPLTPKEKIEEQKNPATWLAIAVFGKRAGERMKDASFYAPQQINGVVRKVEWIQDRLPSGVKRRVRILVELKHSIQVGDKLTGRHGNKGVVSSIIPEREMPYLKTQNNVCTDDNCKVTDSHTHLDILLNPLTITGRMNLGQLYETTVGWFAAHQNQDEKKCFIIPPFDKEWSWEKILSKLERNGLANKQILYIYEDNEETKLEYPVTVGYQYFLKLKHLAEKKLKARSQFVYNPTTGQPTVRLAGNKWDREWENKRVAQRLGEMEVWSLEAHSARNILDELLFLKSDDENLRQQIVEYIRETDRSQKQAFHQIIIKAREKKWKVETEGLDLKVICRSSEEAELREAALKLGLKTEKINEGTFLLHFAPLDLTQREHRAFKAFVHYCRALGLEIEGINRKGREFALVGRKASPWPEIIGLGIRLATDEERKKWSGNQVIKSSGTRDDGLWSNRMFGDIYNRSDINFINEATGIIELEMAVDNPLFRPVLGLLLDKRGYLLDEVRDKFQELVIELYPSIQWTWEDFWKKASEKRSSLQTVDDLIDWLESLQHDGSDTYTREELAKVIENKFSKINQFNFKEVLNPESHYYMNSRRLFHHFAVMDLKRLKAHLEATDELKAREKRQLELVEILLLSGYDLTVLFIKNLIVLPKNLRFERKRISNDDDPQYENDLNYLYQRILNQNQRIRNFCHKKAAEIMCTSEEEKLRRLVYALLSNDKIKGTLEEPLCWPGGGKVLRSILSHVTGWERGKESIFRQHLLGKRADFSARGVIVPDPALNLDEAGLPYSVGKALFRDFLINRLLKEIPDREEIVDERGKPTEKFRKILFGERLVKARELLKDEKTSKMIEGWLDELASKYLILLNRAPSLHRLSMLAFHPRFHEKDDVLRLNPYVCAPFNADFDGDTMAVHLPALSSSKEEALRMLPSKVLRSPGHGKIVINHKGDLALACYLLTQSEDEFVESQKKEFKKLIRNTGLASQKPILAKDVYFLFEDWYKKGPEIFEENLKELTGILRRVLRRSGLSIGIGDLILDQDIRNMISEFEKEFEGKKSSFLDRHEPIRFWDEKTQTIKKKLEGILTGPRKKSSIRTIMVSEAAKVDLTQLSGMRGIMLRPGGGYMPYPVCSSIVQGMTPLEYFISCHGSRHGLSDKGLMTGPAGDLTNILVQAVQAEYIVEKDCGTRHGLWFSAFDDPQSDPISLKERIKGRFLAEDITLDNGKKIESGTPITEEQAEILCGGDRNWIKLRSPITCQAINKESPIWLKFVEETKGKILIEDIGEPLFEEGQIIDESDLVNMARLGITSIKIYEENEKDIKRVEIPPIRGICQRCYGLDLATCNPPPKGYPAGIIAAQSIGEPGTQLTLRTFHTGGIAGQEITQGLQIARRAFSAGIIEEPLKSFLSGTGAIIHSPNGLYWLEIRGRDFNGKERFQRFPVIDHEPVSGFTKEMEQKLCREGKLDFKESMDADGSRLFSLPDIKNKVKTMKVRESFQVSDGQRVYLTNRWLETQSQNIFVTVVCEKYGPLAASEYLLSVLQRIYNAKSKVADHHFEVILRTMTNTLNVTNGLDSAFNKGETLSLPAYLVLRKKPEVSMNTVLRMGLHSSGFLSRICFRQISENLMRASLRKETDWLKGLKEKIMVGRIRLGMD